METYSYIAALRKAGRSLARELDLLRNPFKHLGLNVASVHILLECDNHRVITQQQLSNVLKLNKSYINKLVSNLKDKDLITIEPAAQDKRRLLITLTDSGQDILEEVEISASFRVERALDYMSEKEAGVAYEGLKIYSNALKKARQLEGISFRMIEKKDNEPLAELIKEVLAEFGANQDGFAFADPELDKMFEAYRKKEGCCYLVALRKNELLGGVGIGPLEGGDESVCELRKMYLSSNARGLGLGDELLRKILIIATAMDYKYCYLETLSSMSKAISLYQKSGFKSLYAPRGNTGHFGCDTWMLKKL